MKKLTFEKFSEIVFKEGTSLKSNYEELLPYLKDEEETLKIVHNESYFQHQMNPSRLQIASQIMPILLAMPPNTGYEWAAHESLRYADELIKQAKQ